MLLIFIQHNSDEIGEVFVGDNEEDIKEQIKQTDVITDIEHQLNLNEGVLTIDDISLEVIVSSLYHDGDSTWGYTLRS